MDMKLERVAEVAAFLEGLKEQQDMLYPMRECWTSAVVF